MTEPHIRKARPDEAGEIAALARTSITELCTADHGGDTATIGTWLENKTEAHLQDWLARPEMVVFVMDTGRGLAAVGCHNKRGIVLMNYITPAYRFWGISSIMLAHLEDRMRDDGMPESRLVSTKTARGFYKRRGWQACGDITPCMGVTRQPMRKRL